MKRILAHTIMLPIYIGMTVFFLVILLIGLMATAVTWAGLQLYGDDDSYDFRGF